jgi:spatacsin
VNKLLSVNIIYIFLTQVRLLTGVGRYREMNYIFQILKDNEQFEFLLGKGLDKVTLVVTEFISAICNK